MKHSICETCSERHCNGCINRDHYKSNLGEFSEFSIIFFPNPTRKYYVMIYENFQVATSIDGFMWNKVYDMIERKNIINDLNIVVPDEDEDEDEDEEDNNFLFEEGDLDLDGED